MATAPPPGDSEFTLLVARMLGSGDVMNMRWLCRLGLHSDERKRAVDADGYYAKCRRCGRERDVAPKIGG